MKRWLPWVLVIGTILLTGAIRLRLLDAPLERDEGEYAYAGQLLLQGVPPYSAAYNMKFPGTYAAYALIMAAFGQTIGGIHLGLLLVNIATILLLFLLGRRLLGEVAGAVAAASYALLSISQMVNGVFAHATHFVVLPVVAGWLLALAALAPGRGRRGATAFLLVAGMLFGIALIMKQHAVFFVPFGMALPYLARRRDGGWRVRTLRETAWFTVGAALPFVVMCGLLARAGVFGAFRFWTFDYARQYVTEVPVGDGLAFLAAVFPGVIAPSLPIWILALLGVVALLRDERAARHRTELLLFAGASFLAICPGFYFRPHYFVLLLPAAGLLAGVAIAAGARLLGDAAGEDDRLTVLLPLLLFAVMASVQVARERAFFFRMTPVQASRNTYGENPFPEAVAIARALRERTAPADTIAVLGSEPEIYFYAGRRSATGYIYMYGLMEDQPFALRMQQEMIAAIEKAAPAYLVFVNISYSWSTRQGSPTLVFEWFADYARRNYEPAGFVEILPDGTTASYWDDAARDHAPQSPNYITIFRRRLRI
jgi:4-amino-4-deoxy-L-arabinose transferase-like glycosyltransferase